MAKTRFEWDEQKDTENQRKHGVSFSLAQEGFHDPRRVLARDLKQSGTGERYYCIGRAGGGVLTARFSHRGGAIRILGAGYWRKGRRVYEEQNQLQQ